MKLQFVGSEQRRVLRPEDLQLLGIETEDGTPDLVFGPETERILDVSDATAQVLLEHQLVKNQFRIYTVPEVIQQLNEGDDNVARGQLLQAALDMGLGDLSQNEDQEIAQAITEEQARREQALADQAEKDRIVAEGGVIAEGDQSAVSAQSASGSDTDL